MFTTKIHSKILFKLLRKFYFQALATGNAINRIPYFTYDVVVRENVRSFVINTINYEMHGEIN